MQYAMQRLIITALLCYCVDLIRVYPWNCCANRLLHGNEPWTKPEGTFCTALVSHENVLSKYAGPPNKAFTVLVSVDPKYSVHTGLPGATSTRSLVMYDVPVHCPPPNSLIRSGVNQLTWPEANNCDVAGGMYPEMTIGIFIGTGGTCCQAVQDWKKEGVIHPNTSFHEPPFGKNTAKSVGCRFPKYIDHSGVDGRICLPSPVYQTSDTGSHLPPTKRVYLSGVNQLICPLLKNVTW